MKAEAKNKVSISTELYNLRQNKLYLVMMGLLMVGAIIWVLITIMDAGDESEATTEALKYATPINPNLEVSVFDTIESKRLLTEAELELFPINRLLKDRSGNYIVVPYDTPAEEIELLTTGTSRPAATPVPTPRTVAAPATSSAGSATQ